MNSIADKIGQTLFPARFRSYITFRGMTLFVVVLALWNIGLSILMKDQFSQLRRTESWLRQNQLLHSPHFLVLYNIGVATGFWIIYATREKAQYYHLRVICYGMLLGGVTGELLHFLL